MEFSKFIILFVFLKDNFQSVALNNSVLIKYDYLKHQVVNVCSVLFNRNYCIWHHSKYEDLKTFILAECSPFIPVRLLPSEERVLKECRSVLFLDINSFSVCEMILKSSLALVKDIAILTDRTTDVFLSGIGKCTTLFDSMNVVIIYLNNGQMMLLNSTVSTMHYLVHNGTIRRNIVWKVADFQGKLIKVATFHYPPFITVKNESGAVEYKGIEMSLFNKLSAYLNFKWELVPLKSPGRFGTRINGTVVGGVTQALREGAADIGFCNLWQRDLTADSMEFGPALNMIYVTFIVRRPYQLLDQWQALFMIFTVHVWLTIAATFLIITLVYWRACNDVSIISRKLGLSECAVIMFGILTVSSSYYVPVSLSSRLVMLWSFLFALLLTTAVTSSIVTRLTLPLYSPRVDTVKQLVEGSYYWTDPSYEKTNKANNDFFFDLTNMVHRTFEKRYIYIEPKEVSSLIVKDYKIVFPIQKWGHDHVIISIEGISDSTDLSRFRVMRGYTHIAFTSFGFRRYSGYNEAFKEIIQRFIEFGLWEYQKLKLALYRVQNRSYLLEEEDMEEFSKEQQLTLVNLYPAFALLITGYFLASVVLFVELVYHNFCMV